MSLLSVLVGYFSLSLVGEKSSSIRRGRGIEFQGQENRAVCPGWLSAANDSGNRGRRWMPLRDIDDILLTKVNFNQLFL